MASPKKRFGGRTSGSSSGRRSVAGYPQSGWTTQAGADARAVLGGKGQGTGAWMPGEGLFDFGSGIMGGDMPGGGGGGGGRGGGGGGGGSSYQRQLQAIRDQLQANFNTQRSEMSGLRASAAKAIPGYGRTYQGDVKRIYDDLGGQHNAYTAQLQSMARQVLAGLADNANPIEADLLAQGFSPDELRSGLAQDQTAARALSGAQAGFNTRLGQVANQSRADARTLGSSVQQSAMSTMENEYMAAIAELSRQLNQGLMGTY